MSNETKYWDGYYHSSNAPTCPSQFGVFVHNEFSEPRLIIDVGCGSGRDSFFFAGQGHNVLGIDGSEEAVSFCNEQASDAKNAKFLNLQVSDKEFNSAILEKCGPLSPSTVVYARFFIHAITDTEQTQLLRNISELLPHGGVFAVEFRTERDSDQEKTTAAHYRRFVNPLNFFTEARSFGLSPEYFVEGFGFAKYKNDDAHVARAILRQNKSS